MASLIASVSLLVLLCLPWRVDPATSSQQITPPAATDPWVLVSLLEEDPTDTQGHEPVYSMDGAETESETKMVCPVTNVVLLQPTVQPSFGTGGNFSVLSSTMSLFARSPLTEMRQIVKECQPLQPPSRTCDLLWIDGLQSLGIGSFFVKYAPADGSSEFTTEIIYGPEGISFDGSADGRVDGEPVAIPPQLTFVVRRVAMSPGKATLCESVDGGNFTESIVLDVLLTRTLSGCRTHIPGTGSGMARSGMVSLPGRIVVRLLNEDTLLTPREIVVKLGSCDSNEPESSPLSVTAGLDDMVTATLETTTSAASSTTSAATSSTASAATSPSTSSPSSSFPGSDTNARGGVTTAIASVVVGVVVLGVVGLGVVAIYIADRRCRRRKGKPRRVSSRNMENQNDQEKDAPKIPDTHTGHEDATDSNVSRTDQSSMRSSPPMVATDSYASRSDRRNSASSRGEVSSAQDCTVTVHRDSQPFLPNVDFVRGKERCGSFSETESEGSEVALLKEISRNTEIIAMVMSSKSKETDVTHIVLQNEEVLAAVGYVAEKLDTYILGADPEGEQVAHF